MKSWIAGYHPVLEVLRAGRRKTYQIALLEKEGSKGKGAIDGEIEKLAVKANIPLQWYPRSFFQKTSPIEVHQGVMAQVDPCPLLGLEDLASAIKVEKKVHFILILDEIQDPQNLGALLRSASCFGVRWVILPSQRTPPLEASVVKASAGATEYLSIVSVTNLAQTIDFLKEIGFWLYGLVPQGGGDFSEQEFGDRVALVVGSEGKGIRRLVQEKCDFLLTFSTMGFIQSLNASVAGGIGMYEIFKSLKLLEKIHKPS